MRCFTRLEGGSEFLERPGVVVLTQGVNVTHIFYQYLVDTLTAAYEESDCKVCLPDVAHHHSHIFRVEHFGIGNIGRLIGKEVSE